MSSLRDSLDRFLIFDFFGILWPKIGQNWPKSHFLPIFGHKIPKNQKSKICQDNLLNYLFTKSGVIFGPKYGFLAD